MARIPEYDIEREHRTFRDCIAEARRLNAKAQQLLQRYHGPLKRQTEYWN